MVSVVNRKRLEMTAEVLSGVLTNTQFIKSQPNGVKTEKQRLQRANAINTMAKNIQHRIVDCRIMLGEMEG